MPLPAALDLPALHFALCSAGFVSAEVAASLCSRSRP